MCVLIHCVCVCMCVCIHVCVCPSGGGISGQIPVLHTRLHHVCDKYRVTIPSDYSGRGRGRGRGCSHPPPGSSCGHHCGGPQKGFCEEESTSGCSSDADGDIGDQHG